MRPMKAEGLMEKDGTLLLDKIVYPKLVSPKFDGNRCYIEDGYAKSSTGKPIRNRHIREVLSQLNFSGMDGEIIVGDPTAKDVRRKTTSGVSGYDGKPDFRLYVFDDFAYPGGFSIRSSIACGRASRWEGTLFPVWQHLIEDEKQLLKYEEKKLAEGYEGVVLRDPLAPYKQGRSTLKQNWALKLKRFVDAEAEIIGFEELYHNDNEATLDDHGYTKRSSHQENKRPAGVLGALVVRDLKTKVEFKVGTGFDMEERAFLWARRNQLIGQIITYKHFPIGAKDKPNIPSFVDFRDRDDIMDYPEDSDENPFV